MTHNPRPIRTDPIPRPARFAGLLLLLACLLLISPARAADLDTAGDGEHLWLVVEDPKPAERNKPRLLVYHLADDAERGKTVKLEPIAGELMPDGVAAGDGELLIVLKDRSVVVIRPAMSPLLQRWVYEKGSLPRLPDGCTLVSITLGEAGAWALVRVETKQTLEKLDQAGTDRPATDDDQAELKRALGLPEGFELEPEKPQPKPADDNGPAASAAGQPPEASDQPNSPNESNESNESNEPNESEEPSDPNESEPTDTNASNDPNDPNEPNESDPTPETTPEPTIPAYRLIRVRGGRWASSPLPEGFAAPRHAELVMRPGDDRPTIVAEVNTDGQTPGELVRYTPIDATPEQGKTDDGPETLTPPAWSAQRVFVQSTPLGQWTAANVDRQVALVIQRSRSDQAVAAQVLLLRGEEATAIQRLTLPTDGPARWSAVPWGSGLAMVARPGPKLESTGDDQEPIEPIAGLIAINVLSGEVVREDEDDNGVVVLYEAEPTAIEGNADLLIQISAFMIAMVMMMFFYRRAPRGDQLDLPERVVLAGYGRRAAAGFIDLLPGFWLAGVLYDTTFGETVLYWPGNGVAKVLPAMRPGFIVIAVTVVHTTLFEFIFARSLGKWMTGLYVADLSGKPAPPVPALVRAASRVFDLFAPLMLVLVVISPARQRLGDILAKTIVVMREPEEPERREPDDWE